jgi:hypothetical protein
MADKTDFELEYYKAKNAVALEKEKAALQMFIELNKASVESSFRAIRGAFLLNGGAATALLATDISLAYYACSFGVGAFLAVIAMGFAYGTNFKAAETWRPYIENMDSESHQKHYKIFQDLLRYATFAACVSALLFMVTVIVLAQNII